MSQAADPTPAQAPAQGHHTEYVTPYLIVDGASNAIDFYAQAFGAVELMRMPAPDGRLLHAAIMIGAGLVYLSDDFNEPATGDGSPTSLGGSTVALHRFVEDCDAAVKQAVAAGAEVIKPPMDMFWGHRFAEVRDPFGHRWSIATQMRDVSLAETQAAAAEMDWG